MDEATGLVYVPKSYTELNDKGEPIVSSSRIQLAYTTADPAAVVTFDFNSDVDDVNGDVPVRARPPFPSAPPSPA